LFGAADCWSVKDCEPRGPLCRINKGNETWQPISIPGFFIQVIPAIDEQEALHYSQHADYDLPLDFVLKVAGLSGIVHFNQPLNCDEKNLHFSRLYSDVRCQRLESGTFCNTPRSQRARFLRNTASSDATASGSFGKTTFRVVIPKDVSGITVVGGGFTEFHFDSGKEPTLVIDNAGTEIFDGPIMCINATFSSSTICQVKSGAVAVLPHLNLEIQ
jgi:hypothetical protein